MKMVCAELRGSHVDRERWGVILMSIKAVRALAGQGQALLSVMSSVPS